MPTPTSMPAAARRRTASSRLAGGAVPGSVVRQTCSSSVGSEKNTCAPARSVAFCRTIDVAHDERPARDDRERRPRRVELDEAGAREPESTFGGLVRVRRRPECHLVAPPRAARELATEHLGDVRLDADRPPVAIVRRAVGALLEVADVAERAAVRAPHVRVERPLERHAADLRQRRLARLDPVLDPHRSRIEHTFDHGKHELSIGSADGRARRRNPARDAAAAHDGPGTSTPTSCRARRAGRSSTPGSGSPTRRRRGRPSWSWRAAAASRPSSSRTSIRTTSALPPISTS